MSEPARGARPRRWLAVARPAIGVALTVAILASLAHVANIGALARTLGDADLRLVALSAVLMAAIVVLVAVRWRITLGANGVALSLPQALATILSASSLNSISPSKAGDLIKVYAVREKTNASVALGAMLGERVVDVSVLGLIACPAGLASGRPDLALIGLILAVGPALVVPALGVLRRLPTPEKIRGRLEELHGASRNLVARPRLLAVLAVVTFAIWSGMLVIAWMLYHAVGATPTLAQVSSAFPIAVLAALVPFTIAGIGTRDAALMFLLSSSATQAQSLAATLMYTGIVYWGPAVVGAPLVLHMFSKKRRLEGPAHG